MRSTALLVLPLALLVVLTAGDRWSATTREHARAYQGSGFYVRPGKELIVALAKEDKREVTDKVTHHNYQTAYGRLFELAPGRRRVHKLFEIGLSKGSSARLWRKYFPRAEIWFAEHHLRFVEDLQSELNALNVRVVTGDQQDPATLMRWVNETGGAFDVIVDDGGHTNAQQYQSLHYLFQHALKPGGVYVVEDMQLSQGHAPFACGSHHPCAVMASLTAQWLQLLVLRNCSHWWPAGGLATSPALPKPVPWYPLLPRIKSIECSAEMCMFIKCFSDDDQCVYPGCTDP